MSRRSKRAKVTIAALAFPLLLGCGCCDLWEPGAPDRPAFTAEQVVGVWHSKCGGKVSIADGGTFQATELLADSWADAKATTAAVTGAGTWKAVDRDANDPPHVVLTIEGPRYIGLYAVDTDKFTDLEMEVHQAAGTRWCRLSR